MHASNQLLRLSNYYRLRIQLISRIIPHLHKTYARRIDFSNIQHYLSSKNRQEHFNSDRRNCATDLKHAPRVCACIDDTLR